MNVKSRQERRAEARELAKKITLHKTGASDQTNQISGNMITQLVSALALRMFSVERKVQEMSIRAKKADWRSAAILNILQEKSLMSEKEIEVAIANVQQKELNQEIEIAVQRLGLEDVPKEVVAEKGHHAIVTVEFLKEGKVLEGETIKAMIELGKYEVFPELDDAVLGMTVGETKDFGLEIMDQTDSARVTLAGLKRRQGLNGKAEESENTVS